MKVDLPTFLAFLIAAFVVGMVTGATFTDQAQPSTTYAVTTEGTAHQ